MQQLASIRQCMALRCCNIYTYKMAAVTIADKMTSLSPNEHSVSKNAPYYIMNNWAKN